MSSPSPATLTILLVVSDSVIRSVLREMLDSAGYLVITARDVGDAVDRMKECRPDLLVIRPQISSMPGHDAAVYLRTKIPGIPVLIVGGLPDDDRILNRETAERFEIFPRPFQASELLEKVKEVLAPRSSPVAGD